MKFLPYDLYKAQGGTKSQAEYEKGVNEALGGFSAVCQGLNQAFRLAGADPIMETLDRGMNDRSDEIDRVGEIDGKPLDN